MTNTDNQIIKIIKRFNIKEIKKLKLFILIRLLDELKEIDNDEMLRRTYEDALEILRDEDDDG